MGKFLVALIKAIFFAWAGLFTVVVFVTSALFAGLEASGLIVDYGAYHQPSKNAYNAVMAFFTALIFFYVFAREYGLTVSEALQMLRAKWMLRGVGKD